MFQVKSYTDDLERIVYEFTLNSHFDLRQYNWSEEFLKMYRMEKMEKTSRKWVLWGEYKLTITFIKETEQTRNQPTILVIKQ